MYKEKVPRKNAAISKPPTAEAKKRIVLSFIHREEIVSKEKKGFSAKRLALDYGCSLRTVYDIVKRGDGKLLEYRLANPQSNMKCTFKGSDFPLVDSALKMWFYQARAKNMPINQELAGMQAMVFHRAFYPIPNPNSRRKVPFSASNGYVQRFCQRYAIKNRNMHGEKLSADASSVQPFLEDFGDQIKDYSLDQIYNADKSGLNYKSLPTSTLTTAQEAIESMFNSKIFNSKQSTLNFFA